MTNNLILNRISFGNDSLEIYLPNPDNVKRSYKQQLADNPETPFPYWSQVWPAAVAMARFLARQPHYIQGKKVLELAAGLGLPSLVAAGAARQVYCTDYLPEAISTINQSILHNNIQNIECGLLDWNNPPNPFPHFDVVLMSDVNYDPSGFDTLFSLFKTFLNQESTIILSTPQRLLAKPFIERLMPWCRLSEEIEVEHLGAMVPISMMVFTL